MRREKMMVALSSALLAATAGILTVRSSVGEPAPAATTTVTLNTSPLYANINQSYHSCNLLNTTTKTSISFNVQILDYKGAVLTSYNNLVLAGGNSTAIASLVYTGFAHCQITFKGSASYVRANLSVFHSTGAYTDTIAFSEAR